MRGGDHIGVEVAYHRSQSYTNHEKGYRKPVKADARGFYRCNFKPFRHLPCQEKAGDKHRNGEYKPGHFRYVVYVVLNTDLALIRSTICDIITELSIY